MEEFTLPSGDGRTIQFTGELLAAKSSRREPSQLRWTEIEIYRTEAGKYIVHKIGRSVVVHRPGMQCSSGSPGPRWDDTPKDMAAPCPICKPSLGMYEAPTPGMLWETDRHTVHITETGDGVVESAHTQDDDRTTYLTAPARWALREAAEKDPGIAQAFAVQKVD